MVDKIQTTEKIVHNTSSLVSQLPFNNSFCRPLLSFLLDGLSFSDAKKLYSISKRTYGRIVEDDGETLVGQRYAIGVTRTRISDEQKQEIARILDDILQVQSGRNWRYQEVTDKKLYELYLGQVLHGKPVSKTYFVYSVLAKLNIHHSKKMKFCPICEQIENRNENEDLDRHSELVAIQRRAYMDDKLEIGSGNNETALITQDFTQIELESGFIQDLIICKYTTQNLVMVWKRNTSTFLVMLEIKILFHLWLVPGSNCW